MILLEAIRTKYLEWNETLIMRMYVFPVKKGVLGQISKNHHSHYVQSKL